MRSATYSRALLPSHLYLSRVLAWQCSVCQKIFTLTVEEAERHYGVAPPGHIDRAFAMHKCEVVLVARYEKGNRYR
jgi:hypothetical protein